MTSCDLKNITILTRNDLKVKIQKGKFGWKWPRILSSGWPKRPVFHRRKGPIFQKTVSSQIFLGWRGRVQKILEDMGLGKLGTWQKYELMIRPGRLQWCWWHHKVGDNIRSVTVFLDFVRKIIRFCEKNHYDFLDLVANINRFQHASPTSI